LREYLDNQQAAVKAEYAASQSGIADHHLLQKWVGTQKPVGRSYRQGTLQHGARSYQNPSRMAL